MDTFTGGELHFRHIRGTDWEGKTEPFSYLPRGTYCTIHNKSHNLQLILGLNYPYTFPCRRYMPEMGIGLIHMGRHLHEVLPVTSGDRHQLILWARSASMRAKQCPCCWQNFRQGKRKHLHTHTICVVYPRWL